MLDPFITPCCDQKLLRYFFERVDRVGYDSFFSEQDYPMSQFLDWVISSNPVSEITLAVPHLSDSTIKMIMHYLNKKYYIYAEKKYVPIIHNLNLIVGKDVEVPDDILNNPLVTVAKDVFTYNYLLIHKLWTNDASNTNLEADTESQKQNIKALIEKAQTLGGMLEEGNTTKLAYEELEGAWIDYMLSSNLATSTKGTFYTLHGIINQDRQAKRLTSSVTCIKGKYAYDEVMHVLGSVLRTRKVKPTNQPQ